MGATRITREISENCQDDRNMRDFLLELLEYNMQGKTWYRDEYMKIIKKYSEKMENDYEN